MTARSVQIDLIANAAVTYDMEFAFSRDWLWFGVPIVLVAAQVLTTGESQPGSSIVTGKSN